MGDPQIALTTQQLIALLVGAVLYGGGKAGWDRIRGNNKSNGIRAVISALTQNTESLRTHTAENTAQHLEVCRAFSVACESTRDAIARESKETRTATNALATEIANLRVAVAKIKT